MAFMRKLLVSNFQTLDGYYESTNKTFDRFFDYFHEDYGANEAFDEYNTELLRGADTLILSGSTSSPTPSPRRIWHRGRTAPASSAARASTRRSPRLRRGPGATSCCS